MSNRSILEQCQGYYMVEMWSPPSKEVIEWLDARCNASEKDYVISGRRIYIKDERTYTMFILSQS